MIKAIINIDYSYYNTYDERNNKRFISVSCDEPQENYGCGSPDDTHEEALKSIRHFLNKDAYGNERTFKDSEIEINNKTELDFSLGTIKGNSLKRWF